jgi:glycolate oxidase FAD binding subunit
VTKGSAVGTADAPSPWNPWTVGGVAPEEVLRPTGAEEVRSVLVDAAARGFGVVPLGARTDPGCEPPRRPFVVLSTEDLAGVEEHAPEDLTVTARAGTRLGELSAVLAEHRQWVACDPPLAPRRSLGGVVAGGASGDIGTSFGALRDHVLGLTVVTGDGRVLHLGGRVMKNVAGFDLVRLLVGSRGTLGVVISATLRVLPRPALERVLVFRGASADDLLPLCARIRSAPVVPASAVLGGERGGEASLVVRIQGPPAAVDADARRIFGDRLQEAASLVATDPEGRAALSSARDGVGVGELVARASALPGRLDDVLREVWRALPAGTWRADVLSGRVRIGSAVVDSRVGELADLRGALEEMGGGLILQRATAEVVSRVGAYGTRGAAAELASALRRALDPQGVLSPGRFLP